MLDYKKRIFFCLNEDRSFEVPKKDIFKEKKQTADIVSDIIGHWVYGHVPSELLANIRGHADVAFKSLLKEKNGHATKVTIKLNLICTFKEFEDTAAYDLTIGLHHDREERSFFSKYVVTDLLETDNRIGSYRRQQPIPKNSESIVSKETFNPYLHWPYTPNAREQFVMTNTDTNHSSDASIPSMPMQGKGYTLTICRGQLIRSSIEDYVQFTSAEICKLGYTARWNDLWSACHAHLTQLTDYTPSQMTVTSAVYKDYLGRVCIQSKMRIMSGGASEIVCESTPLPVVAQPIEDTPKRVETVGRDIYNTTTLPKIYEFISETVKSLTAKHHVSHSYMEEYLFRIASQAYHQCAADAAAEPLIPEHKKRQQVSVELGAKPTYLSVTLVTNVGSYIYAVPQQMPSENVEKY